VRLIEGNIYRDLELFKFYAGVNPSRNKEGVRDTLGYVGGVNRRKGVAEFNFGLFPFWHG
jgi:hypothetical protein